MDYYTFAGDIDRQVGTPGIGTVVTSPTKPNRYDLCL